MLVVIGIVAVLAALLFPTLAHAKTQAKCTTSLSNLKQIGSGIGIYAGDYDDRAPFAVNENTLEALATNGERYGSRFDPFVNKKLISEVMPLPLSVFRAPFDPGPAAGSWAATHLQDRWISYLYADWPPLKGLSFTSYELPAETTQLMETGDERRNPRAATGKIGCLRMDFHVQIAPDGVCVTQFPAPSNDELD